MLRGGASGCAGGDALRRLSAPPKFTRVKGGCAAALNNPARRAAALDPLLAGLPEIASAPLRPISANPDAIGCSRRSVEGLKVVDISARGSTL